VERYAAGAPIYTQGQDGENFYMLHSGVCRRTTSNDSSGIYFLAGSTFGYEGLLMGDDLEQKKALKQRASHTKTLWRSVKHSVKLKGQDTESLTRTALGSPTIDEGTSVLLSLSVEEGFINS
jgi:CRP-like cAMP-binding protein